MATYQVNIRGYLKAKLDIHHSYALWGTGHPWMKKDHDPSLLNIGPGVELADELTVCAAITQEFLSSQLSSGAWVTANPKAGVEAGRRFFRIDRERRYEDGQRRVDICIERYEDADSSGDFVLVGRPAYIEAKRVRHWSSEISSGTVQTESVRIQDIKDDILKLRKEMDSAPDRIYAHLLLWNVQEKESGSPLMVFSELQDPLLFVHQIKWLPLAWDSSSLSDLAAGRVRQPLVAKSLWVALAEVDH